MKKLTTINDVLDIAIAGEIEAHKLYVDMAGMVDNPWLREAIEGMAEEELQHRAKLEAVKRGRIKLARNEIAETGLAETLEKTEPRADMDYRELLAFAIKKEDMSCRLYERLAMIFSKPHIKELFRKLSREEADHKRRFEIQYEDSM